MLKVKKYIIICKKQRSNFKKELINNSAHGYNFTIIMKSKYFKYMYNFSIET
jgi:hypothetical protein